MDLTAEYDVKRQLNFGTRAFKASTTIAAAEHSGGAIDRLELNTIAARLGGMKLGAVASAGASRSADGPRPDDPRAARRDPRIRAQSMTVRLAYRATLRSTTTGSNWLFTRANGILEAHRWMPWISRRRPFDRPNHGDPFVTPASARASGSTIVSDRALVYATTGEPVGEERPDDDVRGDATSATSRSPRRPTIARTSTTVGGGHDPRLVPARVPGVDGHVGREARAPRGGSRSLGAYPYPTYDLAQTAGGYGMESPGLTWIPTGAGSLDYLVAHETGHQWFYGIVGNDQALQPFADEAAADFVARYVCGLRRASRCSTARLDLSIYQYSSACYYEDIYIQGGNFLDDTRKSMGTTSFFRALRDYLAANRFRIAATQTLLATLDAHTSLNLVPRYQPRFPRLY